MKVIVALLIVAGLPIIGAFLGGVCAWLIGLVFGDLILGFLAEHGIVGYTMFQLGVIFGFIGSFFRALSVKTRGDR